MRLLISVRSRVNCSWNVAMDSRLSSALTRGSLLQSPKRERVGVCESRDAARNKASFGLTLRAFGRMQIVATNTRARLRLGLGLPFRYSYSFGASAGCFSFGSGSRSAGLIETK